MCGKCCEVIGLTTAKSNFPVGDPSRNFIKHAWSPITRVEALKRNPNIPPEEAKDLKFYECSFYEKDTHKCGAGYLKPMICKGFPWYAREPVAEVIRWWPNCSYWHDVPKEQWPGGTDPLPDPNVKTDEPAPVMVTFELKKSLSASWVDEFMKAAVKA